MQVDAALCGRSMVEMLGVLAIIGVLSVGAISGYSKAMLKYKLNKHAEAFSTLIANGVRFREYLHNYNYAEETHILDKIFYQLNLVPDGMTYKGSKIYDNFNNVIDILYDGTYYHFTTYLKKDDSGSGSNMTIDNENKQVCINILNIARQFVNDVYYVHLTDGFGNKTGILYGNNYCTSKVNCLKNMSISDIDQICNTCYSEKACVLYFNLIP